ncbi:hypothetical protein EJ08DRAFT_710168 [Tothia fuscella]|uniref:Uncharacterized protein n=1 Tax=Tothia fuscella TaxID=1048955 RepID=A0A9P4NDK7_9PEZI|nr:hypothetical protein EJ08DRAFT_710168 [Tothia fuscella]
MSRPPLSILPPQQLVFRDAKLCSQAKIEMASSKTPPTAYMDKENLHEEVKPQAADFLALAGLADDIETEGAPRSDTDSYEPSPDPPPTHSVGMPMTFIVRSRPLPKPTPVNSQAPAPTSATAIPVTAAAPIPVSGSRGNLPPNAQTFFAGNKRKAAEESDEEDDDNISEIPQPRGKKQKVITIDHEGFVDYEGRRKVIDAIEHVGRAAEEARAGRACYASLVPASNANEDRKQILIASHGFARAQVQDISKGKTYKTLSSTERRELREAARKFGEEIIRIREGRAKETIEVDDTSSSSDDDSTSSSSGESESEEEDPRKPGSGWDGVVMIESSDEEDNAKDEENITRANNINDVEAEAERILGEVRRRVGHRGDIRIKNEDGEEKMEEIDHDEEARGVARAQGRGVEMMRDIDGVMRYVYP